MVSLMTKIRIIYDSGLYTFLNKCAIIIFHSFLWVYYLGYEEDGEYRANHLAQPLSQL